MELINDMRYKVPTHIKKVTAPPTDIRRNKNDSRRSRNWFTLNCYAYLRLAMPIKPSKPEPNNQTAAGTGTAETT